MEIDNTQENHKHPRFRANIFWGLLGALFFVIILVITTGVFIYVLKWDNNFLTRGAAKIIPYPIMRVNGDFVRFSEYQKDIETLVRFYSYEESEAGLPSPDISKVKEDVLERLKKNTIMKQIAEREGVLVLPEEIDAEYYKIMAQSGSPEQAENTLKDIYGWNEQDFKEQIVSLSLLQKKLKEKLGAAVDLDAQIAEELAKARIRVYIK